MPITPKRPKSPAAGPLPGITTIKAPARKPAPSLVDESSLEEAAALAAKRAREWLFGELKPDGHWCAELESNATITSEYIFLQQALGIAIPEAKRERMLRYYWANQKDDGSWGIAFNGPGDISTTAEVYLALRIIGVDVEEPRLRRAQDFIRLNGGLEEVRIFTRINFALFGLIPWDAIPVIPAETILLPPQSPTNIYALSSWARGTMVPLFIIAHYQPVFALPNGKSANNTWLDHLWIDPSDKKLPYCPHWLEELRQSGLSWKTFFTATDGLLKLYDRLRPRAVREFALKKCEEWVLERQEEDGGWAGIFPPMYNGVLALSLRGYALDSEPVRKGLQAIEDFAIDDKLGFRIQACVSPVWDTILGAIGVVDTGHDPKDPRIERAVQWVIDEQILVEHGDWKVYNPNGIPGGWAFEYHNTWYPDIDDTAAVVIGLLKQDRARAKSAVVYNALQWVKSMQNRDGGFAAFDLNNDKQFLNHIPFSDMESLCDPSSPDVTGRVLEALGMLFSIDPSARDLYGEAAARGLEYLRATQEAEGSWFGRWGVNYIYGTANVLCALSRMKVPATDPMVERGIAWVRSVQNADGGFGECLESYSDRALMGVGKSTASQTAWGVMALLAYVSPHDPAVERGIRWLVANQRLDKEAGKDKATWDETEFTGTGFPNHFYLRYHYYRHYFPLMALGRFVQGRMS